MQWNGSSNKQEPIPTSRLPAPPRRFGYLAETPHKLAAITGPQMGHPPLPMYKTTHMLTLGWFVLAVAGLLAPASANTISRSSHWVAVKRAFPSHATMAAGSNLHTSAPAN